MSPRQIRNLRLRRLGASRKKRGRLNARRFTGQIPKAAITTSFSGLNVTAPELDEIAPDPLDDIAAPIPTVSGEADLSIFTFNRGRRTGDFFHDVLEEMDFQDLNELSSLIDSKLGTYGFAQTSASPGHQPGPAATDRDRTRSQA